MRGEVTRTGISPAANIRSLDATVPARRALRGECYFYPSTTNLPERWELGDFAQQMAVINRQDKLRLCATRSSEHHARRLARAQRHSPRRDDP